MKPIRPLSPAIRAEAAADLNALPHGRITEQGTEAHVFTAGLDDLTAWYTALGGRITFQNAGPGVCLWTLHTTTDHGNGTTVRVHALALNTDQIDADCANAVA
ncbi:hypothetical protein ACIP2X_38220 [Streptomyces sp. NPDC089424]|uniref:hypothetical protein n=1 Tax=Streptomyces sp. NPDC089424 TaxID=3365917 RepID=UPI003821D219